MAGGSLLKQDINDLRPMIAHGTPVTRIESIDVGNTSPQRHPFSFGFDVCLGYKEWLSTTDAQFIIFFF